MAEGMRCELRSWQEVYDLALEAATAFLRELGAAEVRTAVLQEKETSSFPADYVGGRVETWRWIIYPWAVVEDVTGFLAAMDPRPASVAEAARALEERYGIRPPDATIEAIFRLWPDGTAPEPPGAAGDREAR